MSRKPDIIGQLPTFRAELPLPVSVNDLYQPRRGGGVMLSPAARLYYKSMAELLPTIWKRPPWETERLRLEYTLHESDMRRRDVSNYVKSLQDGMEGFIYRNDSQIDEVVCFRGELRETPCVAVVVSVITHPLVREPLRKTREARDKADSDFASKQARNRALKMAGLKVFDSMCLPPLKPSTPLEKKK